MSVMEAIDKLEAVLKTVKGRSPEDGSWSTWRDTTLNAEAALMNPMGPVLARLVAERGGCAHIGSDQTKAYTDGSHAMRTRIRKNAETGLRELQIAVVPAGTNEGGF